MESNMEQTQIDYLEWILADLATGRIEELRRTLDELHPSEVASLLESLPPEQRQALWDAVPPEQEGVLRKNSCRLRQQAILVV